MSYRIIFCDGGVGTYPDDQAQQLFRASALGAICIRGSEYIADKPANTTVPDTTPQEQSVPDVILTIKIFPAGTLSGVSTDPRGTSAGPGKRYIPNGTIVFLRAVLQTGEDFDHWGGAVSGTNLDNVLVMNGNMTVEAYFKPALEETKFKLTTVHEGNGHIGPPTGTYDRGVMSLIAYPDVNWEFDSWYGDIQGAQQLSERVLQINLDSNKTIGAKFTAIQLPVYHLTTQVQGVGTISPASGDYTTGTVTITATPGSGYQFDSWYGDTIGGLRVGNTIQILLDRDKTIGAKFVVSGGGGGGGGGGGTPPTKFSNVRIGEITLPANVQGGAQMPFSVDYGDNIVIKVLWDYQGGPYKDAKIYAAVWSPTLIDPHNEKYYREFPVLIGQTYPEVTTLNQTVTLPIEDVLDRGETYGVYVKFRNAPGSPNIAYADDVFTVVGGDENVKFSNVSIDVSKA